MFSRAEHYRRRGILAQQRAERVTDQALREALAQVATDWFALAEQAEWLDSHYEKKAALGDRSHVDDASYWRNRANQVRTMADGIGSLTARNDVLRIAEDYDRLAERAEERANSPRNDVAQE